MKKDCICLIFRPSIGSSGTESAPSAHSWFKAVHKLYIRICNSLTDQLSDPVPRLHLKVDIGMVEYDNTYVDILG